MRSLLLVAFVAVACFAFHAPLARAALPGQPCTEIGKTLMDENKQNLVACLNNGYGILKWKATTDSDVSCSAGQIVTGVVNGVPQCGSLIEDFSCPSGKAVTSVVNGIPQCGS